MNCLSPGLSNMTDLGVPQETEGWVCSTQEDAY